MKLVLARVIGLLIAFAAPTIAQVTTSVGPSPAPAGARVVVGFSNDGTGAAFLGDGCPFRITRVSDGVDVFTLTCPLFAAILIPPAQTRVAYWNQRDDVGNLVSPGDYMVEVRNPLGGTTLHPLTIGGVDAGLALVGSPRIGTRRNLVVSAPAHGGEIYFAAASTGTTPGIPTCAGTVPLSIDPFFLASINPDSSVFQDFTGFLDASTGDSLDPEIVIPNDPALAGMTFRVSFVTVDPSQPCFITAIAPAASITFQ